MSEHLELARKSLLQALSTGTDRNLSNSLNYLLLHLEASQPSRPVTEMLLQLTERVVALESEMEEMRHWQLGHTTRRPPLSNVLTSEISPEARQWMERWMAFAPSSSAASSPTTERATTAGPLDAETTEALSKLRAPSEVSATASTAAPTPLSQRLRGVLTEAARIHVEQCSECLERLAQFRLWWEMPVQVAAGTTSTSVNQESKPSADSEGPVASPSSASSNVPIPWNHGPEQRFVGKPL